MANSRGVGVLVAVLGLGPHFLEGKYPGYLHVSVVLAQGVFGFFRSARPDHLTDDRKLGVMRRFENTKLSDR